MGFRRGVFALALLFADSLKLIDIVQCRSSRQRREVIRADALLDSYDFVIIGGGTSGLTVADR